MAATENQRLNWQVAHQVRVGRFLRGLQKTMDRELDTLMASVVGLVRRLDPGKAVSLTQVNIAIRQAQALAGQRLDGIERRLLLELRDFAELEAAWQTEAGRKTLTEQEALSFVPITGRSAWKEVLDTPFDGLTVSEWVEGFRRSIIEGLSQEIRAGWVNGETTDILLQRLVADGA